MNELTAKCPTLNRNVYLGEYAPPEDRSGIEEPCFFCQFLPRCLYGLGINREEPDSFLFTFLKVRCDRIECVHHSGIHDECKLGIVDVGAAKVLSSYMDEYRSDDKCPRYQKSRIIPVLSD